MATSIPIKKEQGQRVIKMISNDRNRSVHIFEEINLCHNIGDILKAQAEPYQKGE
jgi:hypothetical protein